MAYRLEGKDIVISGWEEGIADNPYDGIADIRNANISSVPKEVSVNFSTTQSSYVSLSAVSISSADAGTEILTIASTPTLLSGMTITIAGATLPSPLATSTTYWVTKVSDTQIKLSSTYALYYAGTFIDITTAGTPGNWTFTTINMAVPKQCSTDNSGVYWMLDDDGRAWIYDTATSSNWVYSGNRVPTDSGGNGLIYYEASNGNGYMFVIHNSSIDYTASDPALISWNYQWDPVTGSSAGYAATPTQVLKTPVGLAYSHQAIVTPANQAVFCDLNWVDRFFQTSPGTAFDPSNTATYTWDQTQLLPTTDTAQCITFLGQNILVGGKLNVLYPWDGTSTKFILPVFLSESNVTNLVTVNSNAYVFVGNRGRIHITNGTSANVFKKIPDHISGTVEPYFTWGGATFQKNRLYFGFTVATNSGSTLTSSYRGLWSIDLETQAIIGSNQLSASSGNVYASVIIAVVPSSPFFTNNPAGAGLHIGWSGAANGADRTISTPYANSETYIDTDMIPVGTYLKQFSPSQVEWKTSYPIGVNNTAETIAISYRTSLNQSFTTVGTTTVTGSSMVSSQNGTSTVATTSGTGASQVAVSDYYQANFQKAQWVQFRITMSSNATTPTYNRLTEIRVRDYTA